MASCARDSSAHQDTLTMPVDKLSEVVDWVTAELRQSARAKFRVPPGEDLDISLVTNEPWGAYNWYDGNLHSRIEVNTDLPVRATSLMGLLAHEAFPGPPPRARDQGAAPGARTVTLRVERAADQHTRGIHQRRPRRDGRPFRSRRRALERDARSACAIEQALPCPRPKRTATGGWARPMSASEVRQVTPRCSST